MYHAEDGASVEHEPMQTLEEASAYAGDLVYSLSGDPYQGFPVAIDTYSVQTPDGMNHTVSVEMV
jgi:hypothetical protein